MDKQTTQRKVQFYYNKEFFERVFPITYTLYDIQKWMKDKQFRAILIERNFVPIISNANLDFHYLNVSIQPSNKQLKLLDFHPRKKLLFYINNLTHPPGKKQQQKALNPVKSILQLLKQKIIKVITSYSNQIDLEIGGNASLETILKDERVFQFLPQQKNNNLIKISICLFGQSNKQFSILSSQNTKMNKPLNELIIQNLGVRNEQNAECTHIVIKLHSYSEGGINN